MARKIFRYTSWLSLIIALNVAGFFGLPSQAQSCDVKIDWYDMTNSTSWVFQYQTCHPASEVPPCAPGYSRVGNVATGDNFCVYSGLPVPPPNYPGINAGAACLAGTDRTVSIIPTGDSHELQRSPGNQIVDLSGNSYTYTDMQEGVDYRFRAQATNAGGVSGWSDWTGIVRHDLSAPVTTLDLVGLTGNNGWWRSNVSATLPAVDTGCLGMAQTSYTLDSVAGLYTASPIMVTDDGSHSLSYYSSDGVHEESPQNASIQIDTIAPNLQLIPDRLPDGNNGWWRGAVNFTILGTDATSGLASIEYDLDGTGWQTYSSIVTISSDGTHTFDGRVVDLAGWETINGLNVPIDANQPRLQFVAERAPDRNGWYNHSVSLGIDYGDTTSGIAAVIARLNGGQWQPYQGAYLIGGDGEHVFEGAVTDNAGNAIARQTLVKIDITPPVTSLTYDGAAINFTVSDNRSGLLGITLSINGVVTSYTGNPIPLADAGDYVIEFYSTDMAGNSEATQVQHLYHDPNAATVSPISTTPLLQAELACAAPNYQISGFASSTGGLSEVYLIVKPENAAEIILRGVNSYSYNPASTAVEAIAFNYLTQTNASYAFTLVALDASANERRLNLNCQSGTNLVLVPDPNETGENNSPQSDDSNATSDNEAGSEATVPDTQESTDSETSNTNNPTSTNGNSETPYIPYNPSSPTVEIAAPQPSMELTYVTESSSSPLDASDIAEILAAIGMITTTAAAVVITQSETAKKKQEEMAEELEAGIQAVNAAFVEQIQTAQENAEMNAEMQAEAIQEVILQVEQSEANKAYYEHIAALWDAYNRNMETFQKAEELRAAYADLGYGGPFDELNLEDVSLQDELDLLVLAWARATADGKSSQEFLLTFQDQLKDALGLINGDATTFTGAMTQLTIDMFHYGAINFHTSMEDLDKKEESLNILSANLHVSAYFDTIGMSGYLVVQQYFGANGQTVINVGAEKDGIVPSSLTGKVTLHPDNHNIYLGSNVTVATIIHELGHQLDRALGTGTGDIMNDEFLDGLDQQYVFAETDNYLDGRANNSADYAEIFADIFMTAVLTGQLYNGGPYQIYYPPTAEDAANIADSDNPFLDDPIGFASGFKDFFDSFFQDNVPAPSESASPEATPEVTPEVTPESTPEVTPESTQQP